MANIKKMAERKCGSFKGDAKSKCIDNYLRNFEQGTKRRFQKDILERKENVKKWGEDETKWPGAKVKRGK